MNIIQKVHDSLTAVDDSLVVNVHNGDATKLICSLLTVNPQYQFISQLNLLPSKASAVKVKGLLTASRNCKVAGDDFQAVPFVLRATTEFGGNMKKCPPEFVRKFLDESVTKTINGETRTWENIPRSAIDNGMMYLFSKDAEGNLDVAPEDTFEKAGYDPNRDKKVKLPTWSINYSSYTLTESDQGAGCTHVRNERKALAAKCKTVFGESPFELFTVSLVVNFTVDNNDKGTLINIRAPITMVYGKALAQNADNASFESAKDALRKLPGTMVSRARFDALTAPVVKPTAPAYTLHLENVKVPTGVELGSKASAPVVDNPVVDSSIPPWEGETDPVLLAQQALMNAGKAVNPAPNNGGGSKGTSKFNAKLGAKANTGKPPAETKPASTPTKSAAGNSVLTTQELLAAINARNAEMTNLGVGATKPSDDPDADVDADLLETASEGSADDFDLS